MEISPNWGNFPRSRVQVPRTGKPPGAPEYPTTRLVLGLPVSDPVSACPAPGQAQVALLLTGQIKSPGTIGSGRTRIRSRAMVTIAPDSRSFATAVRATQQMWACACKRPRAGGNIGGRWHADIATQDFDLCGWWRLLRFGERGAGSARHEKLFGRDAETCGMYGWLRDNDLPAGGQIWVLSCNESKGTGEQCTLAHVDSKKRRCACNEIKLPAKEFDTDRTARDGHARAARCATPQPEQ